jgi:hypothetical protein
MRTSAVAVAAALAIPLAGCGNGTTPASGGAPPPLVLAGTAAADLAAGAPAAKSDGGWRLSGSLPGGIPAAEPVRELSRGPATRDAVSRLAAALGAGTPRRTVASWTVGSTLSVRDNTGQPWTFGPGVAVCSPPAGVDQSAGAGCSVSSGTVTAAPGTVTSGGSGSSSSNGGSRPPTGAAGTTTAKPGTSSGALGCADQRPDIPVSCVRHKTAQKSVTSAAARRIATAVFTAVGIGPAAVTVNPDGTGAAYVTADPVVSGLPTSGITTAVTVGNDNRVQSGNGWLASVTNGPAYPLISARAAFELLKAQPRPMLAMDMPCQVGKPCPGTVTQVVTGAELGLSLHYRDNGRPVLVPSWLFAVAGAGQPVAQVAVEPRYLAGPTPAASSTPNVPTSVAPPPATAPDPMVSSYTVSADGRTLTVEYGVGVCPPAKYRADAKESDQVVTVIVSAYDVQPQSPDTACIELAKIEHTAVTLQSPLGKRVVQDESGTAVQRG